MKNLSASVLINTSTKQTLNKPAISSSDLSHRGGGGGSTNAMNENIDNSSNESGKSHSSHSSSLQSRSSDSHSHSQSQQPTNITLLNTSSSASSSIDAKKKTLHHHQSKVYLFGVDLSSLPTWLIATILTSIIMAGFISIGYVEEGFKFRFPDFQYGWFMTAVELIIFSIFAMIERLFKSLTQITSLVYLSSASTIHLNMPNTKSTKNNNDNLNNHEDAVPLIPKTKKNNDTAITIKSKSNNDHIEQMNDTNDVSNESRILLLFKINWFSVVFERQMPLKFHFTVATAMMCSRGLTNIALLLLNYPTQVIFKSMKLISVMMGSVFCLKKQYHKFEYLAAPLLVLSAILFTLGDSSQLNFNMLGIIVVVVSLLFDAIHANSQEYILKAKTERDTTMELLVYSNLFAGILAIFISVLTGEIAQIYYDYLPNQTSAETKWLFAWFIIRVACLYIGVSAFVVFTKRFGAVFAVTVTTIRKIMTVLLSYIFYPGTKSFIIQQHGTGTVLFITSLSLWGYGTILKKNQSNTRRR